MMWIRRPLSVLLGLIVFILLPVAMIVLQVSHTFLDPNYYSEALRKATIYQFALGELTTTALDEARQLDHLGLSERFDENPLVASGLSTEEIVSSLKKTLPPEWIRDLVEQAFSEIGKYIVGESAEFTVTVGVGEQIPAMVSEVKGLLSRSDTYNIFYETVIDPAVEDALAQKLPLGLNINREQLAESVRMVGPPEWVQAQAEAALDEVTPYIIGETNTFEIKIQLADRVAIALGETKTLLQQADVYDLLYEEVVGPRLEDSLDETIDLFDGISITSDEILLALRTVAPRDWVQEQTEIVINEASPYIMGKTDSFAVDVSLMANKQQARKEIIDIIYMKVAKVVHRMHECTDAQLVAQMSLATFHDLPLCIPPGSQPDALMYQMRTSIASGVDSLVLGAIPNNIEFTNDVLRGELIQSGAEENLGNIDEVRKIISGGWTYTQDDLREDLLQMSGELALKRLDDVRAFLDKGQTYTERDFREAIVQLGPDNALERFDQGRTIFRFARALGWLIYVPVILVLLFIGFLGGRSWPSRVSWAASALMLAATISFVIFGPVYSVAVEPILDNVGTEPLLQTNFASGFPETTQLATDKTFDLVKSVADDFASGIANKSFTLALIGLFALSISLGWAQIGALVHHWVLSACASIRRREEDGNRT